MKRENLSWYDKWGDEKKKEKEKIEWNWLVRESEWMNIIVIIFL